MVSVSVSSQIDCCCHCCFCEDKSNMNLTDEQNSAALLAPIVIIMMSTIMAKQIKNKRKKRVRNLWTKEWLNRRHLGRGLIHMAETELRTEDPNAYRNFLRMDHNQMLKLLQMIKCDITKMNTNMRECVSPEKRLAVTLRYLATGESYRSLMYSTRIHESTLSLLIPDTLKAIYRHLKESYLKMPSSSGEWEQIAEGFRTQWNFPLCIGALDGKHISFRPPASAGSYYFNYKKSHSIVLLALADANYRFTYIDVGVNGRISDGGVFRESTLKMALDRNILCLPPDKQLPNQNETTPYVIIADEAFPLTRRIMKPFAQRGLDKEKRICNYRFSRARRIIENAFGILANRFRILLNPINLSPDKVEDIVLACCALHNFLATENPNRYLDTTQETLGETVGGLQQIQGPNRSTEEALKIRERFMEYFNTIGAVPWQEKSISIQ